MEDGAAAFIFPVAAPLEGLSVVVVWAVALALAKAAMAAAASRVLRMVVS
ncbi:MAG TPA: hypothetical protein VLI91_00380 [Roseiarcus sp.]|nr:hypothetical protein [Roseiarcus sp.]